jgi:hypothetical protein
MSETPRRNIRVSKELWALADKRATEAGTTLSELIRGWLEDYGAGRMPTAPDPRVKQTIQKLRGLAEQLGLEGPWSSSPTQRKGRG